MYRRGPAPSGAEGIAAKQRATVKVPCTFCRGSGKDPFGVMSALSACPVCAGRGVTEVRAPNVRCAHCRGTGAIKRFRCTVCGGTGCLPAPENPTLVCPHCWGSGDDRSEPAMACLACHGRGHIQAQAANAEKEEYSG